MSKKLLAASLAISLGMFGCSGMSSGQQRTLSGGAMGAGAGALAGAIGGNTALGLAIGATAGAAGGYIYDQHEKSKDEAYKAGYDAGTRSSK